MKILVTGIHGFVGSNLVVTLNKHHDLYGLDIVSPQKDGVLNTFAWNELDNLPPVDVVVHLAGKAHDTKNSSSEQEYFDINVGLTQNIFQHFLKSSTAKFIFFSSVKAIADSLKGDTLIEGEIPNPQTPYGKSKLAAEMYILEEWEKWKETESRQDGKTDLQDDSTTSRLRDSKKEMGFIDKKVYILRPCMIHGPGNKGNLNLLFNLQKRGFPWPLGAFENKRSFCSIDNISFVIQQLIEKVTESGIYLIADDEALSTNRLISLMAESQNKESKIWHIPVQLIKTIARLGDFLYLPLNSERLRKLTESYVVSNLKIKQAISISKMPISAEEGMKKTFGSFK